jgi:carboxymethylenebutenolidase
MIDCLSEIQIISKGQKMSSLLYLVMYKYNDITKPPPPLPTTQSTEIKPGLIVLVPDTEQSLAIVDGVSSQTIKWAEEGYAVVEVQRHALIMGAEEVVTSAIQALEICEKCDTTDKVGLIGNIQIQPLPSVHVCFYQC